MESWLPLWRLSLACAISSLIRATLDERPDMAYNVGTVSFKFIPSQC
jgi:hypothetical protein